MSEKFDTVVIGAGPGGYVAALRLAAKGQSVGLIEAADLGGTCLNCGCIPTKTLLHSSQIAAYVAAAADHNIGISVDGFSIDLAAMIKRKDGVVRKLRTGVTGLLKARKVRTFTGTGSLASNNQVDVELDGGEKTSLHADNIIIATGSVPAVAKIFPADRKHILTSKDILDLTELPASLLVVGGGYIGCEFATFFGELGVEVTVVEMLERILPMGDPDVSAALSKIFTANGIGLLTGTAVEQMQISKGQVQTTVSGGKTITTDIALICTGRLPNTSKLQAEKIGLAMDNGFIAIDDRCRTNVPGVYAIGDVTGKLQLAHVASRQANVAANNILGRPDSEDYCVVPAAVYTHPESASVGLTVEQAKQRNLNVKTASFPLMASGIAMAYESTAGFAKIIADSDGVILGAQLLCPHASDLIHEIAVLIKSESTLDELAATIHAHPTFAEAIAEATDVMLGTPLHTH